MSASHSRLILAAGIATLALYGINSSPARAGTDAPAVLPGSAPKSAGLCGVRIYLPRDRYGSGRQWIVKGNSNDDSCSVQQLTTPHFQCSLQYGDKHASPTFGCGDELSGYWTVKDIPTLALAVSTAGIRQHLPLPSHQTLRQSWLIDIDLEGWLSFFPHSAELFSNAYPKKFTSVGPVATYQNPGINLAVQSFRYLTMKDQQRAAISARATFDCLEMSFIAWTSPELAERTEKDMTEFVRDFTLEPVPPGPLSDHACKRAMSADPR